MPARSAPPSVGLRTDEGRVMAVRVAINGLGRTGRAAFRAAHERGLDIEWVALNDLMGVETLAHLLRHDTVYGRFPGRSRWPAMRSSLTASRSPSSRSPIPPRCHGASSESRSRST